MLAAFRGDTAAVINLLERGADVNARDGDGDTALMFAAYKGHGLVVALLLQYGANVYARAQRLDGEEGRAVRPPQTDRRHAPTRRDRRRADDPLFR